LNDSHPQKRQTIQFLEQEVEKWKRLSQMSNPEGVRRSSNGSSNSDSPEETKGLKLIIEQLTRDNVQVESENRRLKAKLADSKDKSTADAPAASSDDALRDRLEAAERERDTLRSEVTELESLLESKIFREEELEKDLESLRKEHATTPPLQRRMSARSDRPHSVTPPTQSPPDLPKVEESSYDESLWCEICEERGHDILGCKAVFGDKPTQRQSTIVNGNGKVGMGERRSVGYCENCDRWDHTTEGIFLFDVTNVDCPYGGDTF
jgi:hypothetical protein